MIKTKTSITVVVCSFTLSHVFITKRSTNIFQFERNISINYSFTKIKVNLKSQRDQREILRRDKEHFL